MRSTDPGTGELLPERQDGSRELRPRPAGDHCAEPQQASSGSDVESEWVRKIAAGDRSAFERLYYAYQRRLFGYLFRMVGGTSAAEELTNDVLLEVWKGAAGFKGESKVSTWIFGIARFRAISSLRRNNPAVVDLEDAGPLKDSHDLQDEVLVKQSTREEVREALTKLSQHHREVIELTFYQGFSYPEIAAILDCPVNTVKTRMFYARRELRELLGEGGLYERRTFA